MRKCIARAVIEFLLVIVSVTGIISTYISSGFMNGWIAFLFFTVQSNMTIAAISLVFMIDNILKATGRPGFVNEALRKIKYVFTVAITITFLVFFTMLAPLLGIDYLLSYNNFSLHAIVPILALVDFFVFDMDIHLTKLNCLLGTLMPLYYLGFFLIGIPLGFRYIGDDVAPYFFLNYEQNGWFEIGNGKIGVFYWIIIMMLAISGLCLIFYLFVHLRQKFYNRNK